MTNELEKLVNKYGIFAVLDGLSGVVGRKAELPELTEQETADWAATESAIDAAASKILDLFR